MKKVLMIIYFYPPVGSGGFQRTLCYVKYLREFGWEPSVLAVDNSSSFPVRDYSLLKEVPNGIEIQRTRTIEPRAIWYALRKLHIESLCCIPDRFIGWLPFAYYRALRMMKKNDYDVIYTASTPCTSHLVGHLIKKKTGKPWVADFRDEWTQNPFIKYGYIGRKINEWLERKVLLNADKVISVSEPITEGFSKLIKNKNKFETITNGYNKSDFSDYKPMDTFGDKFRITYIGSFYGGYPSGKQYPYHFFRIIAELLKENKINRNDLEIVNVGDKEKIDPEIPKENIDIVGYVPHKEVFKYMENTTILLLVVQTKRGKGTYTGKIFECIASEKPILALVSKNGVAADLIQETNTGVIVDPDDVDGIKKAILDLYQKWENNSLKIKPNWEAIKKYDRRNLTKKLASIFDKFVD